MSISFFSNCAVELQGMDGRNIVESITKERRESGLATRIDSRIICKKNLEISALSMCLTTYDYLDAMQIGSVNPDSPMFSSSFQVTMRSFTSFDEPSPPPKSETVYYWHLLSIAEGRAPWDEYFQTFHSNKFTEQLKSTLFFLFISQRTWLICMESAVGIENWKTMVWRLYALVFYHAYI